MSKRNNFFGSKTSLTARTIAFLAATGITDTTIINALNTMDLALIANSLDTKMKALYPFVGGTATTHKYNFMNPADTDAAFRLTFAGGWAHSSTGALPNGVNAEANTHFNALTNVSQNDHHTSVYQRQDVVGNRCFISAGNNTIAPVSGKMQIFPFAGTMYYMGYGSGEYGVLGVGKGFYLVSRIVSTTSKLYKNGSAISTNADTSTVPVNANVLLARANTTPYYSNNEIAFCSLGNGFSDTQEANLYTLVQNFQTALSRNI